MVPKLLVPKLFNFSKLKLFMQIASIQQYDEHNDTMDYSNTQRTMIKPENGQKANYA